MGFVELHFHLLPAVDDGPSSIEESVALAAAAVADGTRTVVATPHVHAQHVTDPGEIPARVRELAEALRRQRVRLAVLPGGEVAHEIVERLTQRQLEAIAHGPASRRWLLLEAPFSGLDAQFTAAADELRARGFAVVIAHPERAQQTLATATVVTHELAVGSVPQLSAWSLAGLNGEQARIAALRMLRTSQAAVIASDAHGGSRMPALRQALAALAAGTRKPERFAAENPRALLDQGLAARAPVRIT